jgi:hypothetical protein
MSEEKECPSCEDGDLFWAECSCGFWFQYCDSCEWEESHDCKTKEKEKTK